jgi:hypothetical protein
VGRPASGMRGNSRGGRGNRGRREYKESCFQMCAEANTSSESGVRPSRRAFPPGRQNLPGQVLHRPRARFIAFGAAESRARRRLYIALPLPPARPSTRLFNARVRGQCAFVSGSYLRPLMPRGCCRCCPTSHPDGK